MSAGGEASIGLRAGQAEDPDRYELRRTVAAGAEGILYDATRLDGEDGVRVAVKMLHPGHHADFDRWARRWIDQAELLEHLAAPGLVRVRDSFVGPLPHTNGTADPTSRSLYLVMDWVEGEPLWTWAEAHKDLSADAVLLPLLQVGTALDLLHSGVATSGNTLIHGDVKPSNILISPSGTVLVDLGAVRMFDAARQSGISGTHGYLAPEVLSRGQWSAASDRYALGCVALAVLCGKEPPQQASEAQLRSMLEASPRCQQMPEVIDHVMTMLATDPDARPTNCANWLAQVRGSSIITTAREAKLPPIAPGRSVPPDYVDPDGTGSSGRSRGWWVAAAGAIAAMLIGATAVVALSGDDDDPTTSPTSTSGPTTSIPDPRQAYCVRRTDGVLNLRQAPAGDPTGFGIDEGMCDVREFELGVEELVSRNNNVWRRVEWQDTEGWVADEYLDPVGAERGAASTDDDGSEASNDTGVTTTSTTIEEDPFAEPPPGPPQMHAARTNAFQPEGGVPYEGLILYFDRPVLVRPTAEGDAAKVVVYGGDSSCESVVGTGEGTFTGSGTSRLSVAAPIEVELTYVRVEAGLVSDTTGQFLNDRSDCLAASNHPLAMTG